MSQVSHQDIMDALNYAQKKYWQYTNADVGSTKNLEKEINDMDERRLMNGMKKGMTVEVVEHPNKRGWRGTIEAFDYNHLRVGVRFFAREELTWFAPSCLRVAYQHVSFIHSTDGINWTLGTSYKPKKVIYDETAGVTVVLWMDGTKTIVRAAEGEEHDAYLGYCIALAKKMHGTNSALKRDLEKVLVVKEDKKLNTPLPTMKELADKVTEVMQKFNDAMTKGE